MNTSTETPSTALPITAADAVHELTKLDLLLRERSAIRSAREQELRDLLGRSGGADALENIGAINADMIRLSTALDIEARAVASAERRVALLSPIVASEVSRLAALIAAGLSESLGIVQARAAAVLSPYFDQDDIVRAAMRTRLFRAEVAWQQAHTFGSGGLQYVIGPNGAPVLSDEMRPEHLVGVHRRAVEIAGAVEGHLAEVKTRRA